MARISYGRDPAAGGAYDLTSRIPKVGSAARSEPDELSSLDHQEFNGIRMASGANAAGDRLDHPAAGSYGTRDYGRDFSADVEAVARAKRRNENHYYGPANDWRGPNEENAEAGARDGAYNADWRGDHSSGW